MRIVSWKAHTCEQVCLRASQLRDRTAVHVPAHRADGPVRVMSLAPRRRGGGARRRCPQEKRGISAVLAGRVERRRPAEFRLRLLGRAMDDAIPKLAPAVGHGYQLLRLTLEKKGLIIR